MSDEEYSNEPLALATRAGAGESEALAALIERHRLALFRTAFAELRRYDDAQDAVAEAIVRVCGRAARQPTPVRDFLPWMHQIVRNEARRLRQRAGRRRESSLESELPPGNSPDFHAGADVDLALEVRGALRRLPADQARAMALYYLDGLSVAAIAAAIARPVGTVKWMLSRGRANLAPLLEGYGTMPTKSPEALPARSIAALAAPSLTPEYRRELAGALATAGWDDVRIVADAGDLLRFSRPAGGDFALPLALDGCGLIVLDERVGGRASAFELLPLLAAARRRGGAAISLCFSFLTRDATRRRPTPPHSPPTSRASIFC